MEILKKFRDREIAARIVEEIRKFTPKDKIIKIMHVCGTHENTIARYALRNLLPETIDLIAGPGCPVCICPAKDIDEVIYLSKQKDIIVATYGDMVKTPATETSLWEARASGANVVIVYSAHDAIKLAEKYPMKKVIFFSVGFETTAPGVASEIVDGLPENFYVYSSHRLIPPAMDALLSSGKIMIDGIIAPGHVSTIIGVKPYEIFPKKYKLPVVIAGFEPIDVLFAIMMILKQLKENEPKVENEYSRVVTYEGNKKAQKILYEAFETIDAAWRGLGVIPKSGLELRKEFDDHNARKNFEIKLEKPSLDIAPGCSCNKVILGQIKPPECPMFGKACTPQRPYGPCMVSQEGTCRIWYKYSGTTIRL